jgi:hypothetical protein
VGGGRITVKCSEKSCHAVMDELMFSRYAVLIEAENNARRLGDREAGGGESSPLAADDLPVGAGREDSDDAPDARAVA